jgi:hypothetical protein
MTDALTLRAHRLLEIYGAEDVLAELYFTAGFAPEPLLTIGSST